MNFRFDYHNKILTILQSLNCNVLENGSAYFGGGTILTLDFIDRYKKFEYEAPRLILQTLRDLCALEELLE